MYFASISQSSFLLEEYTIGFDHYNMEYNSGFISSSLMSWNRFHSYRKGFQYADATEKR